MLLETVANVRVGRVELQLSEAISLKVVVNWIKDLNINTFVGVQTDCEHTFLALFFRSDCCDCKALYYQMFLCLL